MLLWTALLAAAAFGLWSETTALGRRLSGALVTMVAGFALSNLGLVPTEAPEYDAVWGWFVPLAIPLLLLRANLARIVREAGPTLVAFAFGALGTVLGAIAAFYFVPVGPASAQLAGIFCATYIGGSINYVAVAEALGLRDGTLLSAGVAADNVVMALYFVVLLALPSVGWLRRGYARRHEEADGEAARDAATGRLPTLLGATVALALAAGLCAAGFALADLAGFPSARILFVTALAVGVATVLHRPLSRLEGVDVLGALFMQVFFAVIGVSANVVNVLRAGPLLFVFALVIIVVHMVTILALGRLLKLDLLEIVIASNANIGGPSTAAAMAVARRWETLVMPAVLTGTLGYAIANFIGAGLGTWLAR